MDLYERTAVTGSPCLYYNTMKEKSQEVLTENLELHDINAHGKERPWREKKLAALDLAETYKALHMDKKAERLTECANFLEFAVTDEGTLRLRTMNSCRVRLCPMCGWRRSLKIHSNMMKILSFITEMYPRQYSFLMLTLTVPNVSGDELDDEIKHMMKSWHRLAGYKAFETSVVGWYRGLEVTHNKKMDTYHPHYHCILCVDSKYFTDKRLYIERDKWLEMWQKATGYSNITQVDIRKIKPGKKGIVSAVCEVAKYTVKDRDYTGQSKSIAQSVVRVLDKALHQKKLVAYGGWLAELHKMLNLDDEMDGDLVHVENEAVSQDDMPTIVAYWNVGFGNYYIRG